MKKEELEMLLKNNPVQNEIHVPGTVVVEGREYCYVSNSKQVKFDKLFDKLFNCGCLIVPKDGGCVIEGCKIILPDGEMYEAISYRGDIEGWRQLIEYGAKALNEKIARINMDTESIVLEDMQSYHLSDCNIDFDYCVQISKE